MAALPKPDERETGLLAAVRQGDAAAFRALFATHHEAVFRAAFAVTLDRDEAADVVQEVFVKLHRRPPADASLRGWLLRVAMNEALGLRRRLRAWRRPSPVPPLRESAEGLLGKAQLAAQMRASMARLPAKQRAVLALHLDADQDPAEIAQALGLTANHARVLLHRGLTRLRAEAAAQGLEFPADDPRLTAVEHVPEQP